MAEYPNYANETALITSFFCSFKDDSKTHHPKYMAQLIEVSHHSRRIIEVSMDDLHLFIASIGKGVLSPELQNAAVTLAQNIQRNTRTYHRLFCGVIDALMPEVDTLNENSDKFDILAQMRKDRFVTVSRGSASEGTNMNTAFPSELLRRYELYLIPTAEQRKNPMLMRSIKASYIGGLVTCRGIVTRVSEVQPLLRVMVYTCNNCGSESYQPIDSKEFKPLNECPSATCQRDGRRSQLDQQTRASKFVKFQELKLQEIAREVPVGHIPRSITLYANGELTRKCTPGDIVTVSGIFLPTQFTGYRAVRAGLVTNVYIDVMCIEAQKKSFSDYTISAQDRERVFVESKTQDIYKRLAVSIAPEIYGHLDVKRALLLTLIGGVTRVLPDVKIRGDINLMLMGDPGVAKSQLLKQITQIAPRSVYVNGKGSSGVGLTAAVIRDQKTGEMSLEGGALVLADKGVCCIDEFDKMEESDKTAIHEVMEQQSVSIAKAGIITTLNARTAIIAAANPVFGRWNTSLSAEKNLGLSPALLSRFDLTFILLDEVDEETDEALARHICDVHMNNRPPESEIKGFNASFLRAYISEARRLDPLIPPELSDYLADTYVQLRKDSNIPEIKRRQSNHKSNNRQKFCTLRTLLSIIRMSQALARLHFRDRINQSDVEEADRLLFSAKRSGEYKKNKRLVPLSEQEQISSIYTIFKNYSQTNRNATVRLADVRNQFLRSGINLNILNKAIEEYQALGHWNVISGQQGTIQAIRFLVGNVDSYVDVEDD